MTDVQAERNAPGGAGAGWVRDSFRCEPSPLGAAVADLLNDVFAGIYHLNHRSLRKVDWTDPYVIMLNHDGALPTFDYDFLTQMVVLCHDRCLRLQIKGKGPRILELMFHQREREGGISHRHPTIEDAVASIRARYAREAVK